MANDMECECCPKKIRKGDKYTTMLDGVVLCEEHAPTFQDGVDHWESNPPENDEEREAAEDCRKALADHVAKGGKPTDKPLWVME